jgi:hypothetical protein
MRILVFTEGTLMVHPSGAGLPREAIVRQVQAGLATEPFRSYVPLGAAAARLRAWQQHGAEIVYLTSRTRPDEVEDVRAVLREHGFPEGELYFRAAGESYADVAERVRPDVLVEDDCESIGGEPEMTYPHTRPELKARITSIVVPEFGGIDHLPDDPARLGAGRM